MAIRITAGGGWGDDGLEAAGASDALRRRVAEADAQEARAAARADEERRLRTQQLQENAIAMSVRQAEERGEMITMHDRLHGRGRTKAEALRYYSALGDLEDARRQAKVQREFQRWQQRESDSWSGDTTAPGEVDIAELEQIRE